MQRSLHLGWLLELIPRVVPPEVEDVRVVGHIVFVDLPRFGLDVGNGEGYLFRLNENGELCVRESDRALFEIGSTCPNLEKPR